MPPSCLDKQDDLMQAVGITDFELNRDALRTGLIFSLGNEFDRWRRCRLRSNIRIEIGVGSQIVCITLRQAIPRGTVRHEVRPIIEIVLQSECMPKFMRQRILIKMGGHKRDSPNFPSSASSARRAIDTVDTNVGNEYINIFFEIINARCFIEYTTEGIVIIVNIRLPSVNAVHYWFTSGVGLQLESTVPVAEILHLLGKEGLNLDDGRLHPIDDFGAIRAIIGQEVDEPNRARLPNVQLRGICGTQSSSIDLLADPQVELYG